MFLFPIVQKIHWFGAFLTYIGGVIWMLIHTIISIFLSLGTKKGQWRRRTAFLRLVIALLTLSLICTGIGAGVSSAMQSDEGKKLNYYFFLNRYLRLELGE